MPHGKSGSYSGKMSGNSYSMKKSGSMKKSYPMKKESYSGSSMMGSKYGSRYSEKGAKL